MFPLIPPFWSEPMTQILTITVLSLVTGAYPAIGLDEQGNVHYGLAHPER